jgi:hypothetical protein
MTNLSRRLVLTSTLFVPVAPAICRADSLMRLTGVNMDPIVIGFRRVVGEPWLLSSYNRKVPGRTLASAMVEARTSKCFEYQFVRQSQACRGWSISYGIGERGHSVPL